MHPEIDVTGGFGRCDDDLCDAVRGYSRLRVDVEGALEREEERNSEDGELHGCDEYTLCQPALAQMNGVMY